MHDGGTRPHLCGDEVFDGASCGGRFAGEHDDGLALGVDAGAAGAAAHLAEARGVKGVGGLADEGVADDDALRGQVHPRRHGACGHQHRERAAAETVFDKLPVLGLQA